MGSPVSAIMANMVVEHLEQQALATTTISPRFWKRYVDDVCSAIKPSQIDSLQSHLNSCQPSIQFTIETETNGSIAFLDTQMTRGAHGQLSTTVHRKPTHTDRYLSYDSHHPVQHKEAVARSLMDRASNLPSSNSDRKIEARQVITMLESNSYPKRFILRSVTNSKWRSQRDTTRKKLCGFTTIPYIGGVSEPIKKILNQHNIQVALKPYKTIGSMFPKPKDPVSTQDTRGVIYKISCNECSKTYIGESKRKFKTRIKEHKKKPWHN